MRLDWLEALAPVCPRCLHGSGRESRIVVGIREEMRGDLLWQGVLHCSDRSCWAEYPVIDGVAILVPDVPDYLRRSEHQVLGRSDLAPVLRGMLGDALTQSGTFDTDRQHLSLYGWSHYADWSGAAGQGDEAEAPAPLAAVLEAAADLAGADVPEGRAIDIGCSVGRGSFDLARRGCEVVGVDLNFSMLRLAQTLLTEGRASVDLRRVGTVYDAVEISLPADWSKPPAVDFWAADAMRLPFAGAGFDHARAINLVDCIAGPTNMLSEMARILRPEGLAVLTTPYDWAESATDKALWMGGHSQRGPTEGRGEGVLRATLAQHGLPVIAERDGIPWTLRMHDRAVMTYTLDMLLCRREADQTGSAQVLAR